MAMKPIFLFSWTRVDFHVVRKVKNPGASSEAFKNMISRHEEKPKQASGYQTQGE